MEFSTMIIEYHRPDHLAEALALLSRSDPHTIAIGGGSALDRSAPQPLAVVDTQSLGLDTFEIQAEFVELGASLTLQALLLQLGTHPGLVHASLQKAIQHEASNNLRQVGTVAGTLIVADGRSPFATVMLALDAALLLEPGNESARLGDLLPFRRERLLHRLITRISIPANVRLAYEYVARSPADLPIVCVGAALWPSGRIRVSLGGYGSSPVLVFDDLAAEGAEIAARSAYSQAGDSWASAEYRQDVAGILTRRTLQSVIEPQVRDEVH